MKVPINRCAAGSCAYNLHGHCHAVAVEVVSEQAVCDLFTRSVMFTINPHFMSQVSLCRMSGCVNNRHASCLCLHVGFDEIKDGAVCDSYVLRPTLAKK